jgi:hypothetical protein
MSCSTLGPQFAMMAGPVGREGGDVMRPWPRMVVGRRAARAAVVKCMLAGLELCNRKGWKCCSSDIVVCAIEYVLYTNADLIDVDSFESLLHPYDYHSKSYPEFGRPDNLSGDAHTLCCDYGIWMSMDRQVLANEATTSILRARQHNLYDAG